MNRFLEAVSGVLESGEVTLSTRFRELPDWCSLKAFGLLVMMENDFAAPIDVNRLHGLETVRELMEEAIVALAARVFKVERPKLSPATAYGSLPEWDSVNHLRLVMEAEKLFGVRYPMESVPELRRLGDFVSAL